MTKLLTALLLFHIGLSSFSQIPQKEEVDNIFQAWHTPNSPGCGLGIIQDGKLIYAKGFGMANLEYDIPNSPNSVFRIGSTSKQFTAACIVLLSQQGKLSLDQTLDEFFPEFPEYAKTITVKHLLNHTSGIRDYLGVAYLKGLRDDDYYENKDIMKWLINQSDLNFIPGDEFLYSNSGYWLLGQIVEVASGMNMADYAAQEIFKPLNMTNTHFHNDHTQIVKNRASGYVPMGEADFRISMTTLDMIGDGGIFTTINDVKKWDDAYYQSDILNQDFWNIMTTPGVLNSGEVIDYACGLVVDDYKGLKTVSHGGAFVGFRAELLRFPNQRCTVAIFANRGDANPTRMAYKVADLILKDSFKEEPEILVPDEVEISLPEVEFSIEQMAGTYEIEPGMSLSLSVKNDSLNVEQGWNGATYNIQRVMGNTFQIPGQDGLSFIFSMLENDFTQQMTVMQGGQATPTYRREEVDTASINLSEYLGDFYSQEMDVIYHFDLMNDKLKLSVGNREGAECDFSEEDIFYSPYGICRFERNNGKVRGFVLDSGRVKNLKFQKQ